MLSEARHSTRSPSESVQTGSVRTGPKTSAIGDTSRPSSVSEEEEPSRIPPAPPLPSTIRVPSKSPSTTSSGSSTTTTQSTPKRLIDNTSATKPTNQTSFQKSTYRRGSSDKKSSSGVGIPVTTANLFQPKQTTKGNNNPVGIRDLVNGKSTSTYASQVRGDKTNKSIFEKVDTHDGHTTYLGAGTLSQLEHCIRDCLSGNRSHHIDITNHVSQHSFPHKNLTRASVLEDYSYEGISAPKHQIPLSNNSHHHVDHHHQHYSHHYDHYNHHHYSNHHDHSNHHYHRADHPKSAAELSLLEIREVNDALARYGIPVFSHQPNPYHPHNKPHTAGEILSACRLLLEEPRLGVHSRDGTHAVQHVWDALHHYNPPPPANHGYASPAVRGVASHLFNPNHQTLYDPVHSVASHLFSSPQQPSHNPVQGVASHLFSSPQQPSHNPVQGVASHLFSGQSQSPFGQTFHQYPGNNHYNY